MTKYFYAVRNGWKVGIFDTWEETQQYVIGYQGAVFKKFKILADAHSFINNTIQMNNIKCIDSSVPADHSKEDLVVFTDGSSIGNGSTHSICHYAVVWPFLSEMNERHSLPAGSTNNQAEYTACIRALEQASIIDPTLSRELYIYTDSKLLVNSMTKWIHKWKENNWKNNSILNRDLLEKLDTLSSQRCVHWNHVLAHTNNKDWKSIWNDKVDKLAQSGII